MLEGWIKLYRQSLKSRVWKNPHLWRLWCYCLLKASHAAQWLFVDGVTKPVLVQRGEFLTGRFALHKALYSGRRGKPSPYTVWRWLKNLESMGNLSIKTCNKYSIVTICNYESYQSPKSKSEQDNVQQLSNRCATTEQQVSTNKNDEESKKNGKRKKGAPTKFIKPTAQQVTEYAKSIGFDLDGQYFVDSNEAKGWVVGKNKTPMRDWRAVIRTWKAMEKKNGTDKISRKFATHSEIGETISAEA